MTAAHTLRLPAGAALHLAASLWLPAAAPRRLWVCLPGGGMNRRYFDLRPPQGDDDRFSFAAQMRARGDAVLALDHLGIGDSDRPADGWTLTPEFLAHATAHALHAARATLPAVPWIGLGHSMGALLTVLTQAAAQPFAALALLGFSTRGLPDFLPPSLRSADGRLPDPQAQLQAAQAMFRVPYPRIDGGGEKRGEVYGGRHAEPAGVAALAEARDHLLALPALRAMLPGNVAAECAALTVPVFVGVGARDMTGPPEHIPAAFARSAAVELCVLPDTGHSHFLFPSRHALFDRLAAWAPGA